MCLDDDFLVHFLSKIWLNGQVNVERSRESERALERWNKGEADGWKWRSNWIGRFVKMWWHKQSVRCYCTLLEVEGNILKLQEKREESSRAARADRLKCFPFVLDPFSSLHLRLLVHARPLIKNSHKWDLIHFNTRSQMVDRGSVVIWRMTAGNKQSRMQNATKHKIR